MAEQVKVKHKQIKEGIRKNTERESVCVCERKRERGRQKQTEAKKNKFASQETLRHSKKLFHVSVLQSTKLNRFI